jgi:hypothetical protein
VKAGLGDFQGLSITLAADAIDQAISHRNAPRPPALKIAPQWLGLTEAFEGRSLTLPDQTV